MSHLVENSVIQNDEVEDWASSIFNLPKHQIPKIAPSRKKQKVDTSVRRHNSLRVDNGDIAIKLSLSQDDNNVVDNWNHTHTSPRSLQDGLFTSNTFDFSLPATSPRTGNDLIVSPPEIRKQFSLSTHKLSSPMLPTFPAGDVQQLIATLSPKEGGGSLFKEIQGRIQHLSPGQTVYNVASDSDDGSPCRPHNWGLQDEQSDVGDSSSTCFHPPKSELRQSRVADTTKSISEPITPSRAHIYQTVSSETSSPAILNAHCSGTADYTPDTRMATPNAVTNVSNDSTVRHNIPLTWSQAPLPPFVSQKGESAYPELMHRLPQHGRYPLYPGWNPIPQFHAHFNAGSKGLYPFHPPARVDHDFYWNRNQTLLRMFRSQFGHCNVPEGYGVGTEYEGLYKWCQEQRVEYHKMCLGEPTTMTPARRNALMSLGFTGMSDNSIRKKRTESDSAKASWRNWLEKLTEYRNEHGNVDVPLKYEPCPPLGTFVNRQRSELRKMEAGKTSSLTPERIHDLNKLGFTWALGDSHISWGDRFKELKQFRESNGHCNVPKQYPKNPALGYWVNEQRSQFRRFMAKKSSYMTEERVQALKQIGFKWSMREVGNGSSNWNNWLQQLRAYKDEHGDTDVPLKYPKNSALGAFVNRQRTEYRKKQQGIHSSLTEERMESLNELGFKWQMRVSRTPWEQRLRELREFKERHGHCNVPSTWSENQPLAYWVFKQRGQYRMYKQGVESGTRNSRCSMTADRIAQLDLIGFEWSPSRKSQCQN